MKITPWQRAVLTVRVTYLVEGLAGASSAVAGLTGCWLMLTRPCGEAAVLMVLSLACAVVVAWDTPLFNIRIDDKPEERA